MFKINEAAKRLGISEQDLNYLKDKQPGLFEKIGSEFYIDAVNLEFLKFQMEIKAA